MVVFVKHLADRQEWHGSTAHLMDDGSLAASEHEESLADLATKDLPGPRRVELLSRVVAAQILPRLAQVSRVLGQANDPAGVAKVTTEVDTQELVHLLMTQEESDIIAFIERLQLRGATPAALYTGILSDAARLLGDLWQADRCDFVQVTICLGQLQQIARVLSPVFQSAAVHCTNAYSVLLLPAPGEQHTFGLLILGEFFSRAGWHVAGGPASTGVSPAAMVRQTWFDVAGFSIGSEDRVESLAKTIRQVRRSSRNRALCVMVGGPLFVTRPELVAQVGADSAAMDAPGAVRQAGRLMTMRALAE